MGLGDGAHDGQAEARRRPSAGRRRRRARSDRRSARGRPSRPPGRCRRPTAARGRRAGRCRRDHVAVDRVLHRVVGEVHHGLGQALAVRGQAPGPHPVQAPLASGEPGHLAHQLLGEDVEVEVLQAQEVDALGLGQGEEVVDEATHAIQLVHDERDGLPTLVRVVPQQLEVTADDRDRRAQLVAGIADERPLAAERGLQAVEHVVERARELADLIVAAHLDAPGQVALADRAGGVAEVAQGGEDAAGQQERDARRDEEHGQRHASGDAQGVGDLGLLRGEIGRHDERPARAGLHHDGHRQVAQLPARALELAAARLPHPADLGQRVAQDALRVGHSRGVHVPAREGEDRLALAGDVALQEDVEDRLDVVAERLAGLGVVALTHELAELVDLLDERVVDALPRPGQLDLALGDERGDLGEEQQHDERGQDPCACARQQAGHPSSSLAGVVVVAAAVVVGVVVPHGGRWSGCGCRGRCRGGRGRCRRRSCRRGACRPGRGG